MVIDSLVNQHLPVNEGEFCDTWIIFIAFAALTVNILNEAS